jgi:hypothetical protein
MFHPKIPLINKDVKTMLIAKTMIAYAVLLGMAFATERRLNSMPPSKRRTISASVDTIGRISTIIEVDDVSTKPNTGPSRNPKSISRSTSEILVFSENNDERYPTNIVNPIIKKISTFIRLPYPESYKCFAVDSYSPVVSV